MFQHLVTLTYWCWSLVRNIIFRRQNWLKNCSNAAERLFLKTTWLLVGETSPSSDTRLRTLAMTHRAEDEPSLSTSNDFFPPLFSYFGSTRFCSSLFSFHSLKTWLVQYTHVSLNAAEEVIHLTFWWLLSLFPGLSLRLHFHSGGIESVGYCLHHSWTIIHFLLGEMLTPRFPQIIFLCF